MSKVQLATGKKRFLAIDFSIEGDKELARKFDFVGKKLDDLSGPLKKSANLLLKAWDLNFDREGAELGQKWAALDPKYSAEKRKKYGQKKILERTGKMRGNFKNHLQKFQTTLSNPTSYFPFHQSKAPRTKLPRRVMMAIDRKRKDEITAEFTKFLDEIRGHFEKK
jgi:phage gpG-like protein